MFVGVIDELDDEAARPWAPTKKDTPADAKRTSWTEGTATQQFHNFISNFSLHHIKPQYRRILEKLLWKKNAAFAKNPFEVGLYN